jgi:hypothetical protein
MYITPDPEYCDKQDYEYVQVASGASVNPSCFNFVHTYILTKQRRYMMLYELHNGHALSEYSRKQLVYKKN